MLAVLAAWGGFERNGRQILAAVAQIDHGAITAVILRRSVDPERRVHVVGDVEERLRRQVGPAPRLTAVGRHTETAVVAAEHELGVLRIDPHRVVVAADAASTAAAGGRCAGGWRGASRRRRHPARNRWRTT